MDSPSSPKMSMKPRATHVATANHPCRWIGCFDAFPSSEVPNLREGVLKFRACTDVPWFIAMILFSAACISIIWSQVLTQGDAQRFYGAMDFRENTCGLGDFKDKPWGAWPDLSKYEIIVCVDDCSATEGATFSKDGITGNGYETYGSVAWCLPTPAVATTSFMNQFEDYALMRYVADMYNHWTVPVYAIPMTFLFLFAFFVFVRFCLKLILRLIFWALLLAIIGGSYTFMQDGSEEDEASYYVGVGILCTGITLWCVLLVFWLPLLEVIGVLEQATKALMVMPQNFFIPVLTFPFMAGVVFAWYYITLLMFSSEDSHNVPISSLASGVSSVDFITSTIADVYADENIDDVENYKEIDWNYELQNTFFIHFFWMAWGVCYIEYLNFVIVAGCVADWFLDRELVDNPEAQIEYNDTCLGGNCTRIFRSIWRVLRYHLGTIAFASALIAAIQTIEAILMYLKEKIGDSENPFAKTLMKCVIAVVKCMDCIMDRCNKNTLVVTAVLGTPFCGGCAKTLGLLFNNMALMTLGNSMICLLVYLANFIIACLSAATAGYIEFDAAKQDTNSMAFPMMAAFIISFVITKIMLGVWDAAATTILVCEAMLHEWYPNEVGKHLAAKAEHMDESKHLDMINSAEEEEREKAHGESSV